MSTRLLEPITPCGEWLGSALTPLIMTFHLTNTPELSYEGSFLSNDHTLALPAIDGVGEATEQSPLLPPAVHDAETGSASSGLPRPSTDAKRRAHALQAVFRTHLTLMLFADSSAL